MPELARPRAQESRHGLRVTAGSSVTVFDRTGRFLWLSDGKTVIRRGLDNRFVRVDAHPSAHPVDRQYRRLTETEAQSTVEAAYENARRALANELEPTRSRWQERLASWTWDRLAEDGPRFRAVYRPVSILPPDAYRTVVVQIAEGCSYNRCLFCDFYRDRPFHIKNQEELDLHLRGIRAFFGERLIDRTGVFLGDGNALVIPTRRILSGIEQIRAHLDEWVGESGEWSTFMDTFHSDTKDVEELAAVRRAGLSTVYIGLESGDDELRAFLDKPGKAAEAIRVIERCKEAGMRVGVILLVGAGGRRFAEQHLEHTAETLAALPLTEGDVVYLSPFVDPPHPAYRERLLAAGSASMTRDELKAELNRWMRTLSFVKPAKVTFYNIQEHLY
jgi:radical SAM superfamily enzyme YgiQ (UPF0313 family)